MNARAPRAPAARRPGPPRVPRHRNIGLLLFRIGAESRRRFVSGLGGTRLRPIHLSILTVLSARDEASQQLLARALRLNRKDIAVAVRELERRGLIERHRCDADRRRNEVRLTADGRAAIRRADHAAAGVERELTAPLGDAERDTLRALLGRIAGALEIEPGARS